MPITPTARSRAQADADNGVKAQKTVYAERLQRLLAAASPPLTAAELSLGLELGEREVGRFLSTSARMASARPDRVLRALVDAILDGRLALVVRAGSVGGRRDVLVADPAEARRLDRSWTVLPLGAQVGLRRHELEDEAVWGLGVSRPRPRSPVRPRRFLGQEVFPLVFGAMRLSTAGRPENAADVLRAALDAGFQVIDTADSYGLDEADLGHNERLVAEVSHGRSVRVVTKAGLCRPGGRWVPDASPDRLRRSCEASLRNLGVEALDLFLLHVVDPKVPFEESVGALARLREEGKIRAAGLSNVNAEQLEQALAILPVAAVQNELNRFHDDPLVRICAARGIPYLAHRPLGGHARAGRPVDKVVSRIAARHGRSAAQVQLAWLGARGVWPVVGCSSVAHARDAAEAAHLDLDSEDLEALGGVDDEVVLVIGPPAAGKTSRVDPFVERGYTRLNRDLLGGTLADLLPHLEAGLATGQRRFVLDNTYPTRESRRPVVEIARRHGVPVRILSVDTPRPEALYNACRRLIQRYGRLPEPEERVEANDIPPQAIHRFFQNWEPPTGTEGAVEVVPFRRARTGQHRALLLDLDGTLRTTRSGAPYPRTPEDVELLPDRRAVLSRYHADGWLLLGVSNQSGIARGEVSPEMVARCMEHTAALLDLPLESRWCPHAAGEIRCWCRKPMPGLGVYWIETRNLDRDACIMVGDLESDRAFAENLGVPFAGVSDFFPTRG